MNQKQENNKYINQKKMKINILILSCVFITLISCTNNSKEQVRKANEKRMIEIADSVFESKSISKNSKIISEITKDNINNTSNTLLFSDGMGNYQFDINNSKITIIYQYNNYEKMQPEYAKLINKKIVVPKDRLVFEGQRADEIYKIEGNKLCVYNPESDMYDCYDFQPSKSSCDLSIYFN